jgi:GTP-binding protein
VSARPLVALVGRPNVGKSTLFNRLVGRRAAIVEDVPGVTRDRNYADFVWEGRALSVVDTGGFEPARVTGRREEGKAGLMRQVQEQARLAVDEASAVVLVVDGREGLTGVDRAIAELLRRSGKPLFVAVNKVDSSRTEEDVPLAEFFGLGFGEVHAVSAEHARGVGTLLDAIVESLGVERTPPPPEEPESDGEEGEETAAAPDEPIRLAIVGRPNVGKSTLVNALLHEERFVVSEEAGTTRDSIDSTLESRGRRFVITDTAGIRRKRSIALKVEQFSVIRAMRAIDDADVAAVILDANEAGAEQDARLVGLVEEKGRALVLVVNKWDVAQEAGATQDWYEKELRKRLPFVAWAPILFVSARDGKGLDGLLAEVARIAAQYRSRLPTRRLNELLEALQEEHPAPLARGRPVKLYYVTQVGTAPPTFLLQCSRPEAIGESYRRFVENRYRDAFRLRVPLRFVYRERERRERPPRPGPTGRGRA